MKFDKIYLSLFCLALGACASTSDLETTRQELAQVNQQASNRLQSIESRLSNERLLEMISKVDDLSFQLDKVKGENEVLAHQIAELTKRQQDFFVDLDRRLAPLEAEFRPVIIDTNNAQADSLENSPQKIQASFNAALVPLKNKEYAKALNTIQGFIDKYPESNLVAEARYWLGVTHMTLKHWDSAIDINRHLVEVYPKHAKAPEALRNIAMGQRELQQMDEARASLRKLIRNYPNSPIIPKIKELLLAWQKD